MKPFPTLLILGAGALAFGFTRPAQESTDPAALAVPQDPNGARASLIYTEERPATIVVRYDPSLINLTHWLVLTLLQPVPVDGPEAPAGSLGLLFMPGNSPQPPGVFVGRVYLHPDAPKDPKEREQLLNERLAALNSSLIERLTVPRQYQWEESIKRSGDQLQACTKELAALTREAAAIAAVDQLKIESNRVASELEMLKLEQPAMERQRAEAIEKIRQSQQFIEGAEAEVEHARATLERSNLLVKEGVQSVEANMRDKRAVQQAEQVLQLGRERLEGSTNSVEFMDGQLVRFTERFAKTKQRLARLRVEIARGTGLPDAEATARKMQLDVSQRILQAKIERLEESISAKKDALAQLQPVSVERW